MKQMTEQEIRDEEDRATYGVRADATRVRLISPEARGRAIAQAEQAEHAAFLKKFLGPELEGWILPAPGNDPYETPD